MISNITLHNVAICLIVSSLLIIGVRAFSVQKIVLVRILAFFFLLIVGYFFLLKNFNQNITQSLLYICGLVFFVQAVVIIIEYAVYKIIENIRLNNRAQG